MLHIILCLFQAVISVSLSPRRVAANIPNKQSRTVDKGWSHSLRVVRGANNSSSSKPIWLRNFHTGPCEFGNEPLGSINCGEFLDWLETYWLLKKDSAAWSKTISGVLNCDAAYYRSRVILEYLDYWSERRQSMSCSSDVSNQGQSYPVFSCPPSVSNRITKLSKQYKHVSSAISMSCFSLCYFVPQCYFL